MNKTFLIVVTVLVCIITISMLTGIRHNGMGIVCGKQWERTLLIEKYDWVHHEKEGYIAPNGAVNIHRWAEQEAQTRTDTDADGESISYTVFETVEYISYDIQEWIFAEKLITSGDHKAQPYWAVFVSGKSPPTRIGHKAEKYIIYVQYKSKTKKVDVSFDIYEKTPFDTKIPLVLNGWGRIVEINNYNQKK